MLKRLIAVVRLAEGKAFAISFGPTFVALVFQLGAFVLLGRALGAAQFGQISAAMALAVVLVEIAGLGSGDLLVRAVVQRPGQFPRYYGSALWLGGLSLPLAAAIGWAVARYGLKLEIQPLPLAALMFAEIAGARVSATAENIAVAHRDVVRASAIRLGYAAARFALAVVVLGLLRVSDVSTWIWWMTGQSLLTAIVFLVISTRTVNTRFALVQSAIASIPFRIRFNNTCCRCTRSPLTAGSRGGICRFRLTPRIRASGWASAMVSTSSEPKSSGLDSRLCRFNNDRIRTITFPARSSSFLMSVRMARISFRSGFSFCR